MSDRQTEIQGCFYTFQQEIDAYNDRRERLIKSSRDITAASKKIIFSLHRFPHHSLLLPAFDANAESRRSEIAQKILKEAHAKKDEIVQMIKQTAKREELDLEYRLGATMSLSDMTIEVGRATRYERAIGSGIEEFVEAISFLHFLENTSLITLDQVQDLFKEAGQVIFPVPAFRYLLGLSDLTGELMRFATNAVGSGEADDVVVVLAIIRDIRSQLDAFVPHIRDMKKKQVVTTQSMRKIEDISYAIKVRSSEYGSNPAALKEMLRRSLASDNRPEREDMDEEDN